MRTWGCCLLQCVCNSPHTSPNLAAVLAADAGGPDCSVKPVRPPCTITVACECCCQSRIPSEPWEATCKGHTEQRAVPAWVQLVMCRPAARDSSTVTGPYKSLLDTKAHRFVVLV